MGLLTPLASKLAAQPWMPRFLPQIVTVDTFLNERTNGRLTLLRIAGLPQLFLTVKGRKSGIERTTPLLYVPHENGPLIAGSNFGQPKAPVWVYNLSHAEETGDTATVSIRGQRQTVRPRELHGEEKERYWQHMLKTWPNYDMYAERAERPIKVFLLAPA